MVGIECIPWWEEEMVVASTAWYLYQKLRLGFGLMLGLAEHNLPNLCPSNTKSG